MSQGRSLKSVLSVIPFTERQNSSDHRSPVVRVRAKDDCQGASQVSE